MKIRLNLLLCATILTTASARGAIIEFDLGPLGLNGANQRPVPLLTTATGGELTPIFPAEPGINYDNVSQTLFLNLAWGDTHGYTDLVGNFLDAGIYGPASLAEDGDLLYSLTPLVNIQTTTDGGIFQRILPLIPLQGGEYTVLEQQSDLMNGLWYINVRTGFAPAGEIRGQLTAVPEPEAYTAMAALGLLGFALYRRRQPPVTTV